MIMLKGKTALVTGSTSGIGLAYARALAEQGANVTINGFGDAAAIEKERAGIEKDFGVKATYSSADIPSWPKSPPWCTTTEKTFGSVDILINNAGIQHVAPIEEFPIEKWDADYRHQSFLGFHTHPRRGARHEVAEVGAHHQHRFGAFAGRFAVQVRLRFSQAWARWPYQDGCT